LIDPKAIKHLFVCLTTGYFSAMGAYSNSQ